MKILLSVISPEEATIVSKYQPDILDIKNPDEGSLGAQFPWIIKDIVRAVKNTEILCSATLGDLPFKPGTAALAAFGAINCGVKYIKAGLYGIKTYNEACKMMDSISKSVRLVSDDAFVVAAGYADYKRFGGLSYMDIVDAAKNTYTDIVMVDTAIKDGKSLFDAMSINELREFIEYAHSSGLAVALAGSIKKAHLENLIELNPDIIGIRGAVCEYENRGNQIRPEMVEEFLNYVRHLKSKTMA